jgi:putative ABC transport system ATP-binding protein
MTGSTVVMVDAVRRTYRRGAEQVHALWDVSLQLSQGEVVALVGPSGSGKTTLLNLLCGWETPDSGTLTWEHDGAAMAERPWAELAIIPQALGLLEDLTVSENVSLPARLGAGGDCGDRYDELVEDLNIGGFLDRRPRDTSLGEQQRTAVARALLLRPRLVLADEPTAHQDAVNGQRILDRLHESAESGGCCLIATHSAEVMAAADRILRLVDGQLV